MSRRKHPVLMLFILATLSLFFSCTPESCLEETNSLLEASFYNTVKEETLAPDSLLVYGVNMDSIICETPSKKISLPLNPFSEDCTFVVKINGIKDTINIYYGNSLHFISKECGYTYYFNIDSIPEKTWHIVKRINILKNSITPLNENNIQILY
jgi:hypothetical protein